MKSILLLFMLLPASLVARDYVIFSISQDFPMGDGAPLKKNLYINMGKNQGLQNGSILDVHRVVSRLDPYHSNKRFNFLVKIGQLEVVHLEEDSAIANTKELKIGQNDPYFEIPDLMIGDHVSIPVED